MSNIFGGNTGVTYADIRRKRKLAEQLAFSGRAPRNVGEGLTAIGSALAGRSLNRKADKLMSENPGAANLDGLRAIQGIGAPREVVDALIKGVPNYARGGIHSGGQAVVGENGPEVVQLPAGAKITPTGRPFRPGNEEDDAPAWFRSMSPDEQQKFMSLPAQEKQNLIPSLEQPSGGLPAEYLQQFDPASQERLQQPGADTAPAPMDMREMIGPQSRFDDAAAYQTADSGEIELPYGDEKLTGDQSKSLAYYRRGYGANQTLSDPKMAEALTQYTDTFAGNFGSIGRQFQDADFQVAKRAADEFLAAILRKDTGAAITNEEFRLYGPMYLPQPGDKPELLAAKAKAREEALIAIEMGLGTAAPLASQTRDELAPEKPPELGEMSDDELLKMLIGG